MAAVIMLLNIRSARVALNGRTIRQACLVLAMAKTILNAHPRAAEFKITTATALSIVVHGGPGDERTLSAGLDSDAIY